MNVILIPRIGWKDGGTTQWLTISFANGVDSSDANGFIEGLRLGDPLTLTGRFMITQSATGRAKYCIQLSKEFFER